MSDDDELLPVTQLRDLADQCGRRHWTSDKPIPASSYFVQRSRVENWRIVARMIRQHSDKMADQRISLAVWCSVCQAVDMHLGEPAMSLEKERTLAALAVADRADAETELAKFACHRMQGGSKSWAQWMGLVAPWEVLDGG
jgi:hypothetical protein